jgi:SAM-dependent methyltransferase
VAFFVSTHAYDRFMGRFSGPLGPLFADFAGVVPGQRAIDVGCGPGALTATLVERLGAQNVCALDPSEPFVAAARERNPGVDVRVAPAEEIPFDDGTFDIALAQLVVHFMRDPVRGIGEMARVVRPGSVVAATVWDHAGGRGPLSPFWDAVAEVDPGAEDESHLAGARQGHLGELFAEAGLRSVEETVLEVHVDYASFEEWWEPYTMGVGPPGAYVAAADEARVEAVRERSRERLGDAFTVRGHAWAARGFAA